MKHVGVRQLDLEDLHGYAAGLQRCRHEHRESGMPLQKV